MMNLFKHFVFHNFWLKLLSLLLATGLWYVISRDQQPAEVAIRIPIEFRHVPENLEISSETIPEAQVRLRGPERLIRQVRSTDLRAEIDVAGARPGERTFNLGADQIHQPRELTVQQVLPSQLHLVFDTRATREVEIHPRVIGAENAKIEVDPPRILISGPKRNVDRVEAATTDPIDVSGTRTRATFGTSVYVSDPLVQVVQPTSIRVIVTMEKVDGK